MYAAPLKACEWNNTQMIDIVEHVTSSVFFLVIKTGTCLCAFYFVVSME